MAAHDAGRDGRLYRVLLDAISEDLENPLDEYFEEDLQEGDQASNAEDALDPSDPSLTDQEYFEAIAPSLRAVVGNKELVEALLAGKFRQSANNTLDNLGDSKLARQQTHGHPLVMAWIFDHLSHDVARVLVERFRGLEARAAGLITNTLVLVDADVPEWVASVLRECSCLYLSGAYSGAVVFAAASVEAALARAVPEGAIERAIAGRKENGNRHPGLGLLLNLAKERSLISSSLESEIDKLRLARNRILHEQIACSPEECEALLSTTAKALQVIAKKQSANDT